MIYTRVRVRVRVRFSSKEMKNLLKAQALTSEDGKKYCSR